LLDRIEDLNRTIDDLSIELERSRHTASRIGRLEIGLERRYINTVRERDQAIEQLMNAPLDDAHAFGKNAPAAGGGRRRRGGYIMDADDYPEFYKNLSEEKKKELDDYHERLQFTDAEQELQRPTANDNYMTYTWRQLLPLVRAGLIGTMPSAGPAAEQSHDPQRPTDPRAFWTTPSSTRPTSASSMRSDETVYGGRRRTKRRRRKTRKSKRRHKYGRTRRRR